MLCCKLVELVDLDVAEIEEKIGLLARIMKNSAQKIHCPFRLWKHSNLRHFRNSQFDRWQCLRLER
jgi:hypothetical protein